MATHLLTWQGSILCQERTSGALLHRPVNDPGPDVDLFTIDDPHGVLQVNIGHFLRNDDTLAVTLNSGALAHWTIARTAETRTLLLSRDGVSMAADADTDATSLRDGEAGPDCWFLAISAEDLAVLRDVLVSPWVTGSGATPMTPANGQLQSGCRLSVGDMTVDLAWNLPFDLSQWPLRLPMLVEGWRIDCLYRYRPLIYYAVFGDDAMFRQLRLSLAALADHGDYDGPVLVMTDRSPEAINSLLPRNGRAPVVVLPTVAVDRMAYMGARLTIGNWKDSERFQPILYVDADTIFDRPVASMMQAIMRSDRISATIEPSQTLGSSDVVGADLLEADGYRPDAEEGINSGVLGIPAIASKKPILNTMARVLQQRLTICGRDSLTFGDQPIINYVGYRLGAIDKTLLAPFVRLSDAMAEPQGKRGIVHFCWVSGSADKADAMEDYSRKLAESSAHPTNPRLDADWLTRE